MKGIPEELEIRPLPEGDFNAWSSTLRRAFGGHSSSDMEEFHRQFFDVDRAIAAFDGGEIVGAAAAISFELTVPGGPLPMALVDAVAVLPTHRRRGVLRSMMQHQMTEFRQCGEIIAGLGASESLIYQRFGYGIASWTESWKMPRVHANFADASAPDGEFRFVEPDEVGTLWPRIYERVRPDRVGMFRYPDSWWRALASDPEEMRHGASAFFHVVYEDETGDEGFVTYRVRNNGSEVFVFMLLGATPKAETALWRYVFGIDLMNSTAARDRPVDDPLPWTLADPRRLERSVRDKFWLRLVDVSAVMSTRSYASECSVVLDVRDSFCPWNEGRYILETGPDGASCTPTNRSPDLALSVSELASVYLGGTSLETLQRAGRVEEFRTGAL